MNTTSIRGVRLQLAEVRGTELVYGQREEFVRDGCNHWHPAVRCPEGELVAEIKPVHGPNAYRGLQILCAPVGTRPGAVGRGLPPHVDPGTTTTTAPRPGGARRRR